jgi:hypothetical protein
VKIKKKKTIPVTNRIDEDDEVDTSASGNSDDTPTVPKAKRPQFKVLSQMHQEELTLVKRAAAAKGKTVSAWCRRVLVDEAAHTMNVPSPDLPEFAHGPNSTVKAAANKLGLSVAEFKRRAAEMLVSQTLAPVPPAEEITEEVA